MNEFGFVDELPDKHERIERFLFVNQPGTPRTGNRAHRWYVMEKGVQTAFEEAKLPCYLRHLYKRTRADDKEVLEAHLDVGAEFSERLVLQVGLGTVFARGLLRALVELPDEALEAGEPPLVIEVKHGTKAALCQLYYRGATVTFRPDGEAEALLSEAQAKFGLGNPLNE